jgi:hypothetical protein
MFKINHMEPNNITFISWVNYVLEHSFTKKNIKFGCKAIGIWPFNPKVMDIKIQPLEMYILPNIND